MIAADGTRLPPGPPARKGLTQAIRYYASFARDPLGFVAGRFDTYGDVYYAPSQDGGLYVLKNPEHMREVLVTRASSYEKTHSAFQSLSRFLGEGLLTSDGETWKRQRRMVQPAFASSRMAGYGEVMTSETVRAVSTWKDGERRDMSRELMELTLRVVSRALFGHDVTPEIDRIGRAMSVFQSSVLDVDRFLPRWLPTPHRRRFRDSLASLDALIYGMIEARRRARTDAEDAPLSPDLLEMLVSARDAEGDGGTLSEKEVRDQLVTLLLAGHETTSHALTWTLYLLSQSSGAEARLHRELDEVLGGRPPGVEDLARLPYTEQVVSEAMRLYPPVYTLARKAREDTEIAGYPVAAGSEVILWVYMMQRDPRFYPEPLAFRPERFAAEEATGRPKHAYLPFGGGPRACIGKAFAMVEARLLLATMAQRFRMELLPGHRVTPQPRITLLPENGLPMVLHARR